jgi:hypothetical protein
VVAVSDSRHYTAIADPAAEILDDMHGPPRPRGTLIFPADCTVVGNNGEDEEGSRSWNRSGYGTSLDCANPR